MSATDWKRGLKIGYIAVLTDSLLEKGAGLLLRPENNEDKEPDRERDPGQGQELSCEAEAKNHESEAEAKR